MPTAPPCLMIQGAGSNVGKSVLVAGLCRYFANQGLQVAPLNPQNMSNKAAVTADGGEIGRAQALQARAARCPASVHMNPVLLKPETDTGAQIIVQGQRFGSMRAREYGTHKASLMPHVLDSFAQLGQQADLLIIEGAGSPAEVNLRAGDIANMGFASAVNAPVVMVGDIDRGGVIASLVGTHLVLDDDDKKLIKAFLINKFRGDTNLFSEGMTAIVSHTGWAGLGILPYFDAARFLPAEDILDLGSKGAASGIDAAADQPKKSLTIAVPLLRRIANFDDLDPLHAEAGVTIELVQAGEAIPATADIILLPGSKSTIADMKFLYANGWDIDILAHHRRGGRVLGLCGGYQMLGQTIADPNGVEGAPETIAGLGLLAIDTVLDHNKTVRQTQAKLAQHDIAVSGYEIHMGVSRGADCQRPFLHVGGAGEGAVSADGRVCGSYLHGLFAGDEFRRHFLRSYQADSEMNYDAQVETILDRLAAHIAASLDMQQLRQIAGL